MELLAYFGAIAALAISAAGSAVGSGAAGLGAIGAWRKCFLQNKPAPFLLIAFVGAPLTQTIYGLIIMNAMFLAIENVAVWSALFAIGLLGGIAIGASALFQGRAAAAASDSFAETGKGFASYLLVLGLIESVALFVMVFLLTIINSM